MTKLTDAQGVELVAALHVSTRDMNLGRVLGRSDFRKFFKVEDPAVAQVIMSAARTVWSRSQARVRDIVQVAKQRITPADYARWSGWTPLR